MENGEGDLRVIENGMSVPVSGLTMDFGNWSLIVVTNKMVLPLVYVGT